MDLTPSQEDYLKTIYTEVTAKGYAKITSIAESLNVKKSSVNSALNILAEKKLVNYAPYAQITLTDEGLKLAKDIIDKYETMINFFSEILKLNHKEAVENSCKIEHVMSEHLFEKITKFYKFTKELYETDPAYRKKLDDFLSPSKNHPGHSRT